MSNPRSPDPPGGERTGSETDSLLHGLHAKGCGGTEYSKCGVVVHDGRLRVVLMTWCKDCGAAAWEEVR